jgi:O-methyltransferase
MIVDFLKNNLFFQNLASFVHSKIPPMVQHNWEKYTALKKAFYLTALEQLEGDYLEFGVFTGSSFVFAAREHKKLKFLSDLKTKFYGFDSFSGFGKVSEHDGHPFYLDNIFKVNAQKVIANIRKHTGGLEVQIVQGYFEQTLQGKTAQSLGVQRARIVFIDCDLKDPAALALNFVKPALQPGTILIMDDFFSYKGDPKKGVAGAYNDFCEQNPHILWRKLYDYGYGGLAYIISGIK